MSGAARPEPICLIAPLGIDALLAVASSRHGPEGHYRLPKGGVYGDLDHDHLRDARVASEFLRVRHEFHAPDERLGAKDLATLRAIRHATAEKRIASTPKNTSQGSGIFGSAPAAAARAIAATRPKMEKATTA